MFSNISLSRFPLEKGRAVIIVDGKENINQTYKNKINLILEYCSSLILNQTTSLFRNIRFGL